MAALESSYELLLYVIKGVKMIKKYREITIFTIDKVYYKTVIDILNWLLNPIYVKNRVALGREGN